MTKLKQFRISGKNLTKGKTDFKNRDTIGTFSIPFRIGNLVTSPAELLFGLFQVAHGLSSAQGVVDCAEEAAGSRVCGLLLRP